MTTAISNTIAHKEVPFMWEPEDQLIGALLHMYGPAAAEILTMVPTTAIQHPVARWAYELITTLVLDHRRDPDPTLVLTLARSQPPAADANTPVELTTMVIRPNVLGDLGNYLANAYTHAHSVNQVREYARLVLDDAFRRTAGIWGARLQALADSYADREEITAAITDIMRGELRDLWQRAECATKPADAATCRRQLTPEQYKALLDRKDQTDDGEQLNHVLSQAKPLDPGGDDDHVRN
ncbi:hypothetical protein [Mycolicibacterium lutetiense]